MIKPGDIVVDDVRQRVGRVMEVTSDGELAFLRPPKGGCEWEADTRRIRPAEPGELVSAGIPPRIGPT